MALLVSIILPAAAAELTVLDFETRRPVPEAVISVPASEFVTGPDGVVALPDLPLGRYRVRVSKPGYFDILDPFSAGHLVSISASGKAEVEVRLVALASISGRVADRVGRPISRAEVVPIVRRDEGAGMAYLDAGSRVLTDERGTYRLHSLPPGCYTVAVVDQGRGNSAGLAATYFPSAPAAAGAAFFAIAAGENRGGTDIEYDDRPRHSLRGKVSGVPTSWKGLPVALGLSATSTPAFPLAGATTGTDGHFVIRNVPSGQYRLTAWGPVDALDSETAQTGKKARFATAELTVGDDDLEVEIELREPPEIAVRLTVRDPACSLPAYIAVRPANPGAGVSTVDMAVANGRFTIPGLPPGPYVFNLPEESSECRVAETLVGEHAQRGPVALLDGTAPLTLVIGAEGESMVGEAPQQQAGYAVLVCPACSEPLRVAALDKRGAYRFDHVPAGPHKVIIVGSLDSLALLDPVCAGRK